MSSGLMMRDEGRALGLTMDEVATQVRAAFQGEEAGRLQRDREGVRAYVRLPADERNSITDIEGLMIPLSGGEAVDFLMAGDSKLTVRFGGESEQQLESFDALNRGLILALLVVYTMLRAHVERGLHPMFRLAAAAQVAAFVAGGAFDAEIEIAAGAPARMDRLVAPRSAAAAGPART